MLSSFASVERALTHYTDPLQPRTGSFTAVPRAGGSSGSGTVFHPALLDDLEERTELRRRMAWLDREEAVVLFRWYVEGAKPEAIARDLGRSLRHVYRRRTAGIEALVALGCSDTFEDADVAEFV
jgi:DNA-directed RNA polymerase specialized sigma24 family protein